MVIVAFTFNILLFFSLFHLTLFFSLDFLTLATALPPPITIALDRRRRRCSHQPKTTQPPPPIALAFDRRRRRRRCSHQPNNTQPPPPHRKPKSYQTQLKLTQTHRKIHPKPDVATANITADVAATTGSTANKLG